MTAVEFEQLTEKEAEAFLADRFCYLSDAGYPPEQALALACRPEIDLGLVGPTPGRADDE